MDPTLTEAELQSLETMVRDNRTISPEEEFINLMVEIIYLEEDLANCRASLDALLDYHFDQLQRGHFHVAVLIIQKVQELRRHLGRQSRRRPGSSTTSSRPHGQPQDARGRQDPIWPRSRPWTGSPCWAFSGCSGARPSASRPISSTSRPTARPGTRSSAFIEKTGRPDPGLLAEPGQRRPARPGPGDHRHPVADPRRTEASPISRPS